jgi:hypothetical protein
MMARRAKFPPRLSGQIKIASFAVPCRASGLL